MRIFACIVVLLIQFQSAFSQYHVEEYLSKYSPMAVNEMERTGIPASIKLAQGLLESDYGRSELAIYANNHFGIKCNNQWVGRTYYKMDDEKDENNQLVESCFRVFDTDDDSYRAHSEFLLENSRYDFLFDYQSDDYISWAKGLQQSGYATDPKYPQKLIAIIDKYDLHKYDNPTGALLEDPIVKSSNEPEVDVVTNNSSEGQETIAFQETSESDHNTTTTKRKRKRDFTKNRSRSKSNSGFASFGKKLNDIANSIDYTANTIVENVKKDIDQIGESIQSDDQDTSVEPEKVEVKTYKIHMAKTGETQEDIASEHKVPVSDLVLFNEGLYTTTHSLRFGDKIYLEQKPTYYAGLQSQHVVNHNETILSIAHEYGFQSQTLRSINHLNNDDEPTVGQILYLKDKQVKTKARTFVDKSNNVVDEVEYVFPENNSKK